jgi:Ser/Thr protein kinase RdoA (MazF antagonist)
MSNHVWGDDQTQYFYALTPEHVLSAVENLGFKTTGRVLQLNSMENRVYEVEIELEEDSQNPSEHFKIIKFYRPGRWNQEQILEEHEFLFDLIDQEIPVIAPLKFEARSLFKNEDGLWYTLFPKKGGRLADEWNDDLLEQMGRLLARLHNVGNIKIAHHRLRLDISTYGLSNLDFLLKKNIIPLEYAKSYEQTVTQICQLSSPLFQNIHYQRVHGDCHHGNTLVGGHGIFLIDFDDMVIAPSVQDIWMVIPGNDDYARRQRTILLEAYQTMKDFDWRELKLIESLRALRMVHFTSWIAHRYHDESFKRAFPDFGSSQYWEKELYYLKEQITNIQHNLDQY